MTKADREHLMRTYAIIAGMEVVLCGVQQCMLDKAYSVLYAIVTALFFLTQTIFCLNLHSFSNGQQGVKYFFIYKVSKFIVVVAPLFAYFMIADNIDFWVAIRAMAYYFAFLIVETFLMVKYQKKYKEEQTSVESK